MMGAVQPKPGVAGPMRVSYRRGGELSELLHPHTLAVFGFGDATPREHADPRYLRVDLQPLGGDAIYEVWESDRPVHSWREGQVTGASDGRLHFGWLRFDESDYRADIQKAADQLYRELFAHLDQHPLRHPLRIWNYLDAITDGEGDDERYRQFCVGRAEGMHERIDFFPAATAIGRHDGSRTLQVYWLAAGGAGTALENPRQVAAWRYPRQYGPRSPSFARAMLGPEGSGLPLMLSGTAAVVGHRSQHVGDQVAQLDETLRNLQTLIDEARRLAPRLSAHLDSSSLLKVYVRREEDLASIDRLLRERLSDDIPRLLLHGEICRGDLLVEIEGFHGLDPA